MSHSPEPWKTEGDLAVVWDTRGNLVLRIPSPFEGPEAELAEANARRVIACVNFCRQFPTDYLEGRQLVYVNRQEDIMAPHVPLPEGFVACTLLPIQKDNQP